MHINYNHVNMLLLILNFDYIFQWLLDVPLGLKCTKIPISERSLVRFYKNIIFWNKSN